MSKPNSNDYPEYFGNYINQVTESDIKEAFSNQTLVIKEFLVSISEEQSTYAYAPGKWTIKEILQHLIDGERIFDYRALCIARGETVSLPSFDENAYAANMHANDRSWEDLVTEFQNLRNSSVDMFNSFTESMMNAKGVANNNCITVLSVGFVTVGHTTHHFKVIKERYLNN